MAPDDNSGGRPAGPVVLRIKLRYHDLESMVQRFAPNVGKSGLFLPTRSIQPVGTEVKFELRLANDKPVLVGLGRVKHVKAPDPANPKAAFGMGIELMRVTREGRDVIIRMIERRRAMGLADVAIPVPQDAEAARRAEVETQPRGETSGVVRDAMAQLAAAAPADALLAAKPASKPIAVAKAATAEPTNEAAVTAAASEPAVAAVAGSEPGVTAGTNEPAVAAATSQPAVTAAANQPAVTAAASDPAAAAASDAASGSSSLMTAPRAGNGSLALARDQGSGRVAVPPLAPEKARPRRPRVEELIDRAAELSARIAVVPASELDMQVDIESVLTRARALAGGDLDAELATLREAAAAPIEITVEAASAELARQLGGKPIAKRERSARWQTPPPVELSHPLPQPGEPVFVRHADAAPADVAPDASESARDARESAPASESARDASESAPGASESARDASESVPAASNGASEAFVTKTRAETEAAPSATIADVVSAAVQARAPAAADAVPVAPDPAVTEPSAAIDADAEDGTEEFERDDRTELATPDGVAAAVLASSPATVEREGDTQRPSRRLFGPADDIITEPRESGLLIDDHADVSALERALDGAAASLDAEPDMLASGEYELADDTPADSTQIGGAAGYAGIPAQLAAQLDQQLAEAEAEAERELADSLAEQAYAQQAYAEQAYARQAYDQPDEQDGAELEEQEVSELDVLAEADEADEDLLAARDGYAPNAAYPVEQGEPAAPAYAAPRAYVPDPEPPFDDFASRLDLGDDDEVAPSDELDHEAARAFDREAARAYDREAARELDRTSGFGDGEEFDEPHHYGPVASRGSEPRDAAPSPAHGLDPRVVPGGRATTEDLEDALAALDVDLDDIAGLQQRRTRRAAPTGRRPLPGLPMERPPVERAPVAAPPSRTGSPTGPQPAAAAPRAHRPTASHAKPPPIPAVARRSPTQQVPAVHVPSKRATTDDGILIDFDDDE